MPTRLSRFVLSLLFAFITTCTDHPPTPEAPTSPEPPRGPTGAEAVVLVGAGDIGTCGSNNDEATAQLVDGIAATVFTLGDNAYNGGTAAEYTCYNATWGRHKARTRPVPGDRDYQTVGAAGYFDYFGAAAGDRDKGYYSYNLGAWHIIALNSRIAMHAGSAQEQWLRADLAANPRQCTLAYWHNARFFSNAATVRDYVKPLWDALYEAGAEVVLNSDERFYERFAPQTPNGVADPVNGIREFIVGTGGGSINGFGTIHPNSEVRSSGTYGVLKLTLRATSYDWEFVPIAGKTFSDAGSGTCQGGTSDPPPNQAPTARPGGPYAAEAAVRFNGSGSSDPDNNVPLTYAWDFGDGTTGTGVAPTKTYSADGSYTATLVVTDTLGLASAPVTAAVTIGNLPPAVNAGADAAVDLGAAFSLNATFTDPGAAGDTPWSWTIAWGDGASQTGSTATLGGPIAASHTYAAAGQYTVRVTVTDKDGGAGSDVALVTVTDPSASAVLVGAGDIAECDSDEERTAALLDGIAGTVMVLGDNAYEDGTAQEYANCYHPTWGRHKARTKPSAGNHEYNTTNATGYFGYFGAAAGDPTKGYYSYDLGAWHVIVLNSGDDNSATTAAGSPQEQWLRADLAAHTQTCTVAYWHHPLWTSTSGRSTNNGIRPLWTALYEFGADLILNGHDHVYERFAPMRPDGTADATFGLRQITVGTGGRGFYSFGTIHPNSEVRNNSTHGVLKVTLTAGGYTWQFIPVAGRTFTDAGSGTCHGRPGGPPPPNQAPTANPGGPYSAEATVTFNGGGSTDPDNHLPLTYAWAFGDGTTGSGATPSHTYAVAGSYTVTLVVTDALGLASAPASTSVTIANVAPSVSAGPDANVSLGSPFNLSATFTDPGGATDAPWAWSIAWGDGTSAGGSTSTLGGPIAASHTYAATGAYTVRVTVTDKDGGAGMDERVVTVTDPAAAAVLVGAGDIGSCSNNNDEATAQLVDGIAATVFTLGDNAYNAGTAAEYACYNATWGRHKARTRPVPGDRDYLTVGAAGYFDYFGAAAGDRDKGYYSYNLGAWHIIALNSRIAMHAGSAQEQWLRADLAANPRQCTLAYWHNARFFSNAATVRDYVKPLWDALYEAGAEVVLNSDERFYERFVPQTPDGVADPVNGIREFIVGTGGGSINGFGTIHPNSEVRRSGTYGVLRLTLRETSYDWQFVPIAGQTFTDSGTTACH